MASVIDKLRTAGKIKPPTWIPGNVMYETIMGSTAYGCNTADSDWDMVSFCVPPKDIVFPHLSGVIHGFGRLGQKFVCYQQHHVKTEQREYDINCYNIVHWFHLCMDNNPNMLDNLFVPRECITHTSRVGEMLREARYTFLHKGSWYRYKGYAFAQLGKMGKKDGDGKRQASIKKYGYDVKQAYHLIRLLDEIEQILTTGDLDLRRISEKLKAIRRGEVAEEDIRKYAADKEHALENMYLESDLPERPDEEAIKQLLLDCLEEHYGSLDGAIVLDNAPVVALRAISEIIEKNRGLLS
jgi:predicted nucleotidyltransferase